MNFSLLKDVEPQDPDNEDSTETPDEPHAEHAAPDHDSEAPEEEESEFVAAEKKPTNQSAMMLFAILIIGGAGIYGMYLRVGPKSAEATPPAVAQAESTIKDFMQEGSGSV